MTNNYKYGYVIRTFGADFVNEPVNFDDTLLEVRLFDEKGEYRAYRSSINQPFKERTILDNQDFEMYPDGIMFENKFIYDEAIYLDLDEKKGNDSVVYATGGGSYHLPEAAKGKDMILVRYYCDFDDDGVARIADCRLCGFVSSAEWKGIK